MQVSIQTSEGGFFNLDVSPETTFETLKNVIQVETQVPFEKLLLIYKGDSSIGDTAKLKDVGVEDKDIIYCEIARPQQQQPSQQLVPRQQAAAQQPPDLMGPVMRRLMASGGAQGQSLFAPLPATGVGSNPRKVMENRAAAIDMMPESFADVLMLYVDTEVNGTPVKAFVDTGAQRTVMSRACAERCNILDLIDTQFAGMAVGVGTSKILGRVHLCHMKLGEEIYGVSFIVLDQKMNIDILIGLDMLKKYRCNVDLENDVLRFAVTGAEVPFLTEANVPEHAKLSKR